jgi:bromodomain-containing factor 1
MGLCDAVQVINPMDFATIRKNLTSGVYASPDDFQVDMKLVFDNCFTYNKGPYFIEDHILKLCTATKRKFIEEWARVRDKIEAAYRSAGKSHKSPAAPPSVPAFASEPPIVVSLRLLLEPER